MKIAGNFKVKADFDSRMKRTDENIKMYAFFIPPVPEKKLAFCDRVAK
jgi:hypothetical protein